MSWRVSNWAQNLPKPTPDLPLISIGDAHVLLVAFSGGADSVMALHIAASTGKPVTLWYLHHYSSPIESGRERVFAEIQTKYPSVTMINEQADVSRISKRLGYSWEHTASLLRRKHLVRIKSSLEQKTGGACVVITGHNYSDYLETLSLRRARALPEEALPALAEQDEITGFVRPLFRMDREQVRRKVLDLGLSYFDDPTNEDEAFARNRVRKAGTPHPPAPSPIGRGGEIAILQAGVREIIIPLIDWNALSQKEKSRTVFLAFRRLTIVRKFTRNHFDRAHRLPFILPPFFAHTENNRLGEVIVFRRGLGNSMRIPATNGNNVLRGDAVTRKLTIAQPFGHKSVAKLFSEKKLSARQRRRTLVLLNDEGTEARSIAYPDQS